MHELFSSVLQEICDEVSEGQAEMNKGICEVGQVEGPACFWMEVFMVMCYVHVIAFIVYVESHNTVC